MGIFFSAAGLPWLLELGLAWAWGGSAMVGVLGAAMGFWAWAGAPRLEDPANAAADIPPRIPLDGKKLVAAQAMFSVGLIPHSIYWVDYVVRGLGAPMSEGALQWSLVGLGALLGTVLWGRVADKIGLNAGLVAVFAALSASIILPVLLPGAAIIIPSSLVFGSQPGSSAVIASRAQQAMGEASMVPLWRWMVVSVGTAQIVGGIGLVELFNPHWRLSSCVSDRWRGDGNGGAALRELEPGAERSALGRDRLLGRRRVHDDTFDPLNTGVQAGGETVIAVDDPTTTHGDGHAFEIAMLDQPGNPRRVLLRGHRKVGVAFVIGSHQKAVPKGRLDITSGDPTIAARPMRIILDPALEREVEDVAFTDTNSHVPLRPGAHTQTDHAALVERGLSVGYI